MAKPLEKNLTNVNIIGSEDNPVQIAYIRRVIGCENLSYDRPTIPVAPETETFNGMTINKLNNQFTHKTTTNYDANINVKTFYINGNGTNAGLRFPGGGVNGEFTNQLTSKGVINADRTGGHSLVAAESIQVQNSYYQQDNQGITNSENFVADLRWNGAVLEYRTGTIGTNGGIVTYLLVNPSWNPVP